MSALRFGRIERYVLVQQARSLGIALGVISALIMLIDFVEISRGVGSDVDLSAARILGLMLLKSPQVIVQLLPFVFLFGTLAAFVALNRRSELIAMRAAGLSAWRFVLPAAGAAFLFGVITVTALGPLAASASLNAGRWRLLDAVGAQIGQRAVRYETLDLLSSLADEEAFERFARPQSTPFWSLPGQIGRVEAAGFSSTAYRLRLQQLLATPLMFAAMSILAAAFSLRLMRLGDLARMSLAAVVLGFGFFFINQAASAFGSAEVVPPWLAAWLPPLLTALAAFTLLFYTEDG